MSTGPSDKDLLRAYHHDGDIVVGAGTITECAA